MPSQVKIWSRLDGESHGGTDSDELLGLVAD
jgi:hypothetical protein